jgi:hypothetical protein
MTAHASGVVYVATEQDRFVVEAVRAAETMRHWLPNVAITLFTDRASAAAYQGLFDTIEPLPFAPSLGTSWGSGLLGKVRALARAPYERCLYLDSDTRVLSPRIAELFTSLEAWELLIATCEGGESRNQLQSRRPMFNSGVIAFRQTTAVRRLLAAWLERQEQHAEAIRTGRTSSIEYVRHLRGVERLYQLVADQTTLAQFLAPDRNVFGVRCLTLSRCWNWRPDEIDDAHRGRVVIHHADRFKVGTVV